MKFFTRRRARKSAAEILRHARHVRNMREDILDPEALTGLGEKEAALGAALREHDVEVIRSCSEELYACIREIAPPSPNAGLRENLEILLVAVAVAMGFRTYFIQPFKIPTGSMQPSLYGIHSRATNGRTWTDYAPVGFVKWLLVGKSYRQVRVGPTFMDRVPMKFMKRLLSGYSYTDFAGRAPLTGPFPAGSVKPSVFFFYVGPNRYEIPKDAVMRGEVRFPSGSYVQKGDVLWSGLVTSGDHLFVNKVSWNFRRPKRGQVTVFSTESILSLPEGTHYIKRLVGMPGERVSIDEPELLIDGEPVYDPPSIGRIARREGLYPGYTLPRLPPADAPLANPGDSLKISRRSYFVLGDNTPNSRDGRYWGTVPRNNLVGPAVVVYWPLSRRWGLIR